jgi:hypothetical protein
MNSSSDEGATVTPEQRLRAQLERMIQETLDEMMRCERVEPGLLSLIAGADVAIRALDRRLCAGDCRRDLRQQLQSRRRPACAYSDVRVSWELRSRPPFIPRRWDSRRRSTFLPTSVAVAPGGASCSCTLIHRILKLVIAQLRKLVKLCPIWRKFVPKGTQPVVGGDDNQLTRGAAGETPPT